ncbi:uncharacterized protein B0T15DRAFT_526393 [Chaetomium strumarium]|uniref:Pentatricopeptide repeat domain-containing protein n=1 Tax=Chaetomium strumarium TaxID=1170767 RepID=A0AAJ0M4X1_9PEZI|nr:hypothetical protein B0T15DRAFT_526393 [Chaetomium strumarium]
MTSNSVLSRRSCAACNCAYRSWLTATHRQRNPGYRNFYRAQSTTKKATTEPFTHSAGQDGVSSNAAKPSRRPPIRAATSNSSSSLIDRLTNVPVLPHNTEGSVVIRPAFPYPHKTEAREDQRRHHRARGQQARLQKFLAQSGDWREVLQILVDHSPTHEEPRDALKVIIPKDSVDLLWTDRENNLWNIKSRTHCKIALYEPSADAAEAGKESKTEAKGEDEGEVRSESEREDSDPYITLSGQPAAMAAAVDDILKVTKGATVMKVPDGSKLPLRGKAVHYHVTPKPIHPYKLTQRADQIPRPDQWTFQTFYQHVCRLTLGELSPSLAKELYTRFAGQGWETHQTAVVKQLLSVFNDPVASTAATIPAFKDALTYLVRAGESFVNEARALVDRARSLGLRIDADVFNILAEAPVKSRNLPAFKTILRQMISDGHRPNLRTWLLFFRLVEAEDVRRYIVHAMDTKNHFANVASAIEISTEMADHDMHRAIQLGQNLEVFLGAQRALYGPEWRLTTRAANMYLDVLGRYGKFEEASRLLEHMFACESPKPNSDSLSILWRHCKLQSKIEQAIKYLRMFEEHRRYVVNGEALEHLFTTAWKTKKPYVATAIWRYALLTDMAPYAVRQRILDWLEGHGSPKLTSRIGSLWEPPNGCNLTRQQFVEYLALCDYINDKARAEGLPKTRVVFTGPPAAQPRRSTDVDEGRGNVFWHLPARMKHRLVYNWGSERGRKMKPAIRLGEFLEKALERDYRVHAMAQQGKEGVMALEPGSVDPQPVPLPLVERHPYALLKYDQHSIS